MADTFLFAQLQPYSLSGAGASIGDTSITLKSMLDIDGNTLSMSGTFGSIGFGTLEPGNGANEEQISFTGLTNNSNGTVTLSGVKSVAFVSPYTATSGLLKTHAGSTTFVISNTSGFYDRLSAKDDDETITGLWNFPNNSNYPTVGTTYVAPTTDLQIATKKYADDLAIAGAPKASTTTFGIATLSTNPVSALSPIVVGDNDPRMVSTAVVAASVGDNTEIAVGSGNKFVTQTGFQKNAEKYAADSGGSDAYAITLSPVLPSHSTGMVVHFKANTANTGAATLNINSAGAKTIVKGVNTTLDDSDILAGQFCTVIYDGTNFVLQNPAGANNVPLYKTDATHHDVSTTGTQTIAHGLGKTPKYVAINALLTRTSFSYGAYNGTTTASTFVYDDNTTVGSNTNIIQVGATASMFANASISVDSTNITLTWSKTGAPTGTCRFTWTAIG